MHPLFKPNAADDIPADKGDAQHPNVALLPWFHRAPTSIEEANSMVSSALEYSTKRIELWDQRETNPAEVQAAAKHIACLSAGSLSHSQGLAAAAGPNAATLSIRTNRAASAPPDLHGGGEKAGEPVGPPAAAPVAAPAVAPTVAADPPATLATSSDGASSTTFALGNGGGGSENRGERGAPTCKTAAATDYVRRC